MKFLITLLASALFTQQIHAAVVLSNTDDLGDRSVLGRDINANAWNATPFTTDGSDYTLNSIVAEIIDAGPTGTLIMQIWSTQASGLIGSSLGQLTLTADSALERTFTGTINLTANTSYFAVLGVVSGGGDGWLANVNFKPVTLDYRVDSGSSWSLGTQDPGGTILQSYTSANGGVSWTGDVLSAPLVMTMNATAIPEPSSALLLGLASLGCLAVRRRTK